MGHVMDSQGWGSHWQEGTMAPNSTIIISVLQMSKPRHRDVKYLAQITYKVSQYSWDLGLLMYVYVRKYILEI